MKECMKINKISPKNHFLTKIKMTSLVFLCCFVLFVFFFAVSSPLEPVGSRCIDD